MDLDEEVREFLIECDENLATLERELVQLEAFPADAKLIASVFRNFHTIKGTSGFFGFQTLGSITHIAENILDQARSNKRLLNPALTSLLLETVDALRALLREVEASGSEGNERYMDLHARLNDAQTSDSSRDDAATGAKAVELHCTAAGPTPGAPKASSQDGVTFPDTAGAVSVPPQEHENRVVLLQPVPTEGPAADLSGADPERRSPQAGDTEDQVQSDRNALTAGLSTVPQKDSVLVDTTIRVDVGLLDKLMTLVGELVLARNQLVQGSPGHDGVLTRTVQRLNSITSELQEGVLKTRMQPIGVIWSKFPRIVRDLANECGKRIRLEMEGSETELDKTIIEAIKDPLTHIVRNSCDHGIEQPEVRSHKGKPAEGVISLRAFHEGGHVNIEISDDGGGLDPEKLKSRGVQKGLIPAERAASMTEREAVQLVFMPGFSTAEQLTTISGRGVGMDVVRTNIQKIGGVVDIFNRSGGSGSTVKIKIPLTLAIIPGLIVQANFSRSGEKEEVVEHHRFVIPQASLVELVRVDRRNDRQQLEYVNGTPVYRRRGQLLPLAYLNSILGVSDSSFGQQCESRPVFGNAVNIVVVQAEERPFGLVVDEICDTQEIVVKPLAKRLKGLSSYLGATIMGDGRVALILDVSGLARLAGITSQASDGRRAEALSDDGPGEIREFFLIFKAGSFDRLALPLSEISRLEQFSTQSVKRASGRPVLHYRGQILPLLMLRGLLGDTEMREDTGSPAGAATAGDTNNAATMQVIVFQTVESSVAGLVVDQIVDIVEATVSGLQTTERPGLRGAALIGGLITDLVDLRELRLLAAAAPTARTPGTGTEVFYGA